MVKNTLVEDINEALRTHDKVIVFTQSENLIKEFLKTGEGRWNVYSDKRYWDIDFSGCHDFTRGRVIDGLKIGLLDSPEYANCGLDHPSKLTFTKNVSFPIKDEYVIKDRFDYPKFSLSTNYPPLLAIHENKDGIVIRSSSDHDYISLHDQLTLQKIKHSLSSISEENKVLIMKPNRFFRGNKIVLYDYLGISDLMSYDQFEDVLLVHDLEGQFSAIEENLIRIIKVFEDVPGYDLNEEYISFKTWMHPETVYRCLKFLYVAGCLKKVRTDLGKIYIKKKGRGPDNDPSFHLIQEGEISVFDLSRQLGISRLEIFSYLERYNGEHLTFSYISNKNQKLWRFFRPIDENIFQTTLNKFYEDMNFLTSLKEKGGAFLNNFIEERLQRYAFENGGKVKMEGEILGDKSTLTF